MFDEVSNYETTGLPKPCMAGSPFLVSLTSYAFLMLFCHDYLLRCCTYFTGGTSPFRTSAICWG